MERALHGEHLLSAVRNTATPAPHARGVSRTEFLTRVRAALERIGPTAPPQTSPPDIDSGIVRLTHPSADLANLFSSRAAAAGMSVHRCTSADAPGTLQQILDSISADSVVHDADDPTLANVLNAPTSETAQRRLISAATGLDAQFDCAAGITGVLAAIAETGTLVLSSAHLRSRGTFLIPPLHIALVHERQLIPDMLDLWPLIGATPPTALTLVSGPSKTADIEGILVTGVHGPRAVHIVLIAP